VESGRLDPKVVDTLVTIIPELPEAQATSRVTAGFMKEVEVFRNRAYFREPLSEFYNYRYLLFLDEASVLQTDTLPYELILVSFPNFGTVQQDIGYLVADQVFDEIGQKLTDICNNLSEPRDFYDGSVMLFRKRNDYLIYQELEDPSSANTVCDEIEQALTLYQEDWGLNFAFVRQPCQKGLEISNAMYTLLVKTET
jgi:hypothetical protein